MIDTGALGTWEDEDRRILCADCHHWFLAGEIEAYLTHDRGPLWLCPACVAVMQHAAAASGQPEGKG